VLPSIAKGLAVMDPQGKISYGMELPKDESGNTNITPDYINGFVKSQQPIKDQFDQNYKSMQLKEDKRHNKEMENKAKGSNLLVDAENYKNELLNDPIKKQMVFLYANGYLSEKEMMAKIPWYNKDSGSARLAMTEAAIQLNPPQYNEKSELIGGFNPKQFALSTKAMGSASAQDAKLQNMKVSQAKDLQTLLDGYKDSKTGEYKDIPPQFVTELTMGAARLVSPSGQVAEGLVKELQQGTAQEKIARALGFFGYKATGSTQQNLKNLRDMFERQGMMAQHIRENYYQGKPQENVFNPKSSNNDSDFETLWKKHGGK
jgi:hypothetical protein